MSTPPIYSKPCLWCGEPMIKGRKCQAEFALQKCHKGSCSASYRHHKKSAADVDEGVTEKHCAACGKLLVRKHKESIQSWRPRKNCDKSCASVSRKRQAAPEIKRCTAEDEARRVGLVHYVPGSPEFIKLCGLYTKRGDK